jgi:hypothetical protein
MRWFRIRIEGGHEENRSDAPTVTATAKAKPLLIPNLDTNGNPFVDKTTGAATAGEITGQPIPHNDGCALNNRLVLPKTLTATPGQIQFLPAVVNSGTATRVRGSRILSRALNVASPS